MMNRLDYLIEYLLKEDPQYSEMEIPSDLQGKRDLFRALRNVRWPKPVSEEFLRLQDEELQAQLQEKGVVELNACRDVARYVSTDKQLLVWQGDITRLKVDAIVNAANSQMLGCFHPLHRCIDNAIHSAKVMRSQLARPRSPRPTTCRANMSSTQSGLSSPTASRRSSKRNNWPHVTEASCLALMKTILKASLSAAFQRVSSVFRTNWLPKLLFKPSKIISKGIPIAMSNRWFSMCLRMWIRKSIKTWFRPLHDSNAQAQLKFSFPAPISK